MKTIISSIVIGIVVAMLLVFAATQKTRAGATVAAVSHDETCSRASLKGSYGFYRTGTAPEGPLGAVGISIFDGHGGFSTAQTIRKNGQTTSDLFADGFGEARYSVAPNCTAKFINPSDGSVFSHAVVVDGGSEIFIISLSGTNTVTGVMKRISANDVN